MGNLPWERKMGPPTEDGGKLRLDKVKVKDEPTNQNAKAIQCNYCKNYMKIPQEGNAFRCSYCGTTLLAKQTITPGPINYPKDQ